MAPRNRGFTLIELMVVIAVIAILMGILIPSIGKVREHAWEARCKSNLKNLWAGATNYANDHGGNLPFASSYEWFHSPSGKWVEETGWVSWVPKDKKRPDWSDGDEHANDMHVAPWWGDLARKSISGFVEDGDEGPLANVLYEYVKQDPGLYLCPSFKRAAVCGKTMPDGSEWDPVRSYVMNSFFGSTENKRGWHRVRYHQLMDVHGMQPMRLLMFTDLQPDQQHEGIKVAERWAKEDNEKSYDSAIDGSGTGVPQESIGIIHGDYGNAIFSDAHIEKLEWHRTTDACTGQL